MLCLYTPLKIPRYDATNSKMHVMWLAFCPRSHGLDTLLRLSRRPWQLDKRPTTRKVASSSTPSQNCRAIFTAKRAWTAVAAGHPTVIVGTAAPTRSPRVPMSEHEKTATNLNRAHLHLLNGFAKNTENLRNVLDSSLDHDNPPSFLLFDEGGCRTG